MATNKPQEGTAEEDYGVEMMVSMEAERGGSGGGGEENNKGVDQGEEEGVAALPAASRVEDDEEVDRGLATRMLGGVKQGVEAAAVANEVGSGSGRAAGGKNSPATGNKKGLRNSCGPQSPCVGLVYDERMTAHFDPTCPTHPERPGRITHTYRRLVQKGLARRCVRVPARPATSEELHTVHTAGHTKLMTSLSGAEYGDMERLQLSMKYNSIYFNEGSSGCALLSAGSTVELAERVASGELKSGIAIVRPPGHHAEADAAMGFCLFNNVAVAAHVLLHCKPKLGIKKVLIVDWDVHHGNGTQHMFWQDPQVLYFSVHRYDFGMFYPCLEDADFNKVGEGPGAGYNVNVPWPKGGFGDADYLAAWDQVLMPIARAYEPDIVLVSAGFDSAMGDPLGGCMVTPCGYSNMTHQLLELANGKVAIILEGGYNLESVARSVEACTSVLLGSPPKSLEKVGAPSSITLEVLGKVRRELAPYWNCLEPVEPESPVDQNLSGLRELEAEMERMVLACMHRESEDESSSTGVQVGWDHHEGGSMPAEIDDSRAEVDQDTSTAQEVTRGMENRKVVEDDEVHETGAADGSSRSGVMDDGRNCDDSGKPCGGGKDVDGGSSSAGCDSMCSSSSTAEGKSIVHTGRSGLCLAVCGPVRNDMLKEKSERKLVDGWKVVAPAGLVPKNVDDFLPANASREDAKEQSQSVGSSGAQSHEDGTYVWYASYGSNMNYDRFHCYIEGGRVAGMRWTCSGLEDQTPPVGDIWIEVPHHLFFAGASMGWGGGGTAFMDLQACPHGSTTLMHAYKIKLDQFNGVVAQENLLSKTPPVELTVRHLKVLREGPPAAPHHSLQATEGSIYGTVRYLGEKDGCPILTFTCPVSVMEEFCLQKLSLPGADYRECIVQGLMNGLGMTRGDAEDYVAKRAVRLLD
ncbi:hypothetical protein CBR_g20016 [Chara braunii]|uniref:Histone deacetylase domain-containing protein n=1 Tax=Chara braunii TaxID=69332 RepID=A0A388KZA7_CHABU|nr:hypothetical protein CBR_g20016 [Chara braunii]|eukprot:GBG75386.1 hypothetical protein CBR_g20016 [Chara braunii]